MHKYISTEGNDVDDILLDWSFDPETVQTRLIRASNGRYVLQMRADLGILQMEVKNRPDGTTPYGFKTLLAYLKHSICKQGNQFLFHRKNWGEAIRELRQFAQRRICWLALGRYSGVVRDADHSLELIRFLRDHALDQKFLPETHEFNRGFRIGDLDELDQSLILFQKIQAVVMMTLRDHGPVHAVEAVNTGIRQLRDESPDSRIASRTRRSPVEVKIELLWDLKTQIQNRYGLGPSLEERMQQAVAREDYELAAKLRDRIRRDNTAEWNLDPATVDTARCTIPPERSGV